MYTVTAQMATPPTFRTHLTPPTAAAMDRNATCPEKWEWTDADNERNIVTL